MSEVGNGVKAKSLSGSDAYICILKELAHTKTDFCIDYLKQGPWQGILIHW